MSECCENCKFFYKCGNIEKCRKYPPRNYDGKYPESPREKFPDVSRFDWCGEFKPKEESSDEWR